MSDKVVHYTTEAPWYRRRDGVNQWDKYVREWTDGDIDHAGGSPVPKRNRIPVVFDVETTGRFPQEPILWTVYDAGSKEAVVAYRKGYQSTRFDPDKVAQVAGEAFKERGLYASPISVQTTVSPQAFESGVIERAINDPTRVLVGHNLFFDLNIAGRPNDGILDNRRLGNDWQAATEYDDYTLLSKRAGAFGHIYSLVHHDTMSPDQTLNIADTRVASKAMLIGGSLEAACDEFDIAVDKSVEEHGKLTYDYIRYNVGDVASTHALYYELRRRLHMDFGANLSPENVYSTATIFKDVLKRMGYDRVHYPKDVLKVVAPSYFGGRTDAMQCGELIEGVTYTDILSEYPTVCTLSDVWRFMRARRVTMRRLDGSDVPRPSSYKEFSDPDTWRKYADYYAVIRSAGLPLPVRTKLPHSNTTRVFNANVTHENGLTTTHHYYDLISAWLLSGEWPEIVTAFRLHPEGTQDLKDANIGGRQIEANDNVLRRAIEERKAIAREYGKGPREQSLKITANAGYGVAAERLVADDTEHLGVSRHDIAGTYYNPHVASTITAGGRLMLAYGQRVAQEHGGRVWYCDTDSLIMDDAVVAPVQSAFDPLNPYDGPAGEQDVLEVEEADGVPLRGVDLYAVGEKKYAILRDGELLKWTEHGLGHYEIFRDSDMIERFWKQLLWESHVDIQGVSEELEQYALTLDELDAPVIFQQPASTATVRQAIAELTGEPVRYGDWLQQTVNRMPRSSTKYVGTDLDSQMIKIEGSEVTSVQSVDRDAVKSVADVLDSWKKSSLYTNASPDVRVVGTKTVTKESATVDLDWQSHIEAALSAVDLSILTE